MERIEIWGYRRADGTFGIRNHVAVIAAMDNSNSLVRRLATLVRAVVPIYCSHGRGQVGEDYKQRVRTLVGLGSHPNVAAALVVSLEPVTAGRVAEGIRQSGRPVKVIALEEVGGTIKSLEVGIRTLQKMAIAASKLRRERGRLDELVVGVKCGGSDGSSGLVSNPAIGMVSDRLVQAGGTVIMSETVEWMGGEHILASRAVNPQVGEKIIAAVQWYTDYARSIGIDILGTNPAPDNIAGGLSTIEEKALGAIQKAGTQPIQEVLRYGERPPGRGLYLMDAPPPGVENVTALSAGGCQVILFSTGRGNPTGNPVSPVLKICGNPETIRVVSDIIDVDVSPVLLGKMKREEAVDAIWQSMLDVCGGTLTKSEALGDEEISIGRIGFSI